jgi:MFS-type transporter involved in bile tolerance (Atg22 family)
MSPTGDQSEQKRAQNAFSLTLAAVVGQVGCLTLVIILGAIFGGIWLDDRMGTRPMFTIGLAVASIPVTLVVMLWVVKAATSRLQDHQKRNSGPTQEDTKGGRTS